MDVEKKLLQKLRELLPTDRLVMRWSWPIATALLVLGFLGGKVGLLVGRTLTELWSFIEFVMAAFCLLSGGTMFIAIGMAVVGFWRKWRAERFWWKNKDVTTLHGKTAAWVFVGIISMGFCLGIGLGFGFGGGWEPIALVSVVWILQCIDCIRYPEVSMRW